MQTLSRPLLAVLGLILAIAACKPMPPVPVITRPDGTVVEAPPPPKPEEEDKAADIAKAAADLEAQGQDAEADAKRAELLKDHPGTKAAADLLYERAVKAAE